MAHKDRRLAELAALLTDEITPKMNGVRAEEDALLRFRRAGAGRGS
jgi:hypothetical protein